MPLILKPFYVMRHGQSRDNARGLISGAGSDPDLTELGRTQSMMACAAYMTLDPAPTRIIVSSLKRTHQTAELVVGHTDFVVDAGLNERHLGELDGKITEAEQKKRKTLPGEEANLDHGNRAILTVNRYLDGSDLPFFICHGGTIRRILEGTGLTDAVTVGNAEIYMIMPDGPKWTILRS
jgi:broad specificity phosphatase PhoE